MKLYKLAIDPPGLTGPSIYSQTILASLISSNSKLFGGTNNCHCLTVIIYKFISQFVGPWWMMLGPPPKRKKKKRLTRMTKRQSPPDTKGFALFTNTDFFFFSFSTFFFFGWVLSPFYTYHIIKRCGPL